MKKLSNKGFSVLELVLIIIVISLLGGVGYYVYKSNNKPKNPTPAAKASESTSQNANQSEQKQEDKFLEVKELGVKLKLSDYISDATYTSEDNGYWLYTKSFEQKFPGCKTGGIFIVKSSANDKYLGSDITVEAAQSLESTKDTIKVINGSYYIMSKHAGVYCTDESKPQADQQMTEEEARLRKDFEQAFQTLEAI